MPMQSQTMQMRHCADRVEISSRAAPCRPQPAKRQTRCKITAAAEWEVRICTNVTCKRQGSHQVLKFAQDLNLANVDVKGCSCLGNCGSGPNMVILPTEVTLRHVSTPADFAEAIKWQCQVDIGEKVLKATELRLAGNSLAVQGDTAGAIKKYQQALALNASQGAHMLHSNLSAAYLQSGLKEEALSHAQKAVELAPYGCHNAHVRLIDAYYALERFHEASQALDRAVAQDARFKSVAEYPLIVKAVQSAVKASKRVRARA